MPARSGPSAAPESHAATLMPPQCGRIVLSERMGAGHAGRTPGVAGPVVSNALKRLRDWGVRTWLLDLLRQKHTLREFLSFGPSEPAGHSSLARGLQAPAQTCCSKAPGRGSLELRKPGWKHSKRDSSRGQWFSKCGPQTSSISTTWALGRNAGSRAPPRPMNTGVLRNGGVGPSN